MQLQSDALPTELRSGTMICISNLNLLYNFNVSRKCSDIRIDLNVLKKFNFPIDEMCLRNYDEILFLSGKKNIILYSRSSDKVLRKTSLNDGSINYINIGDDGNLHLLVGKYLSKLVTNSYHSWKMAYKVFTGKYHNCAKILSNGNSIVTSSQDCNSLFLWNNCFESYSYLGKAILPEKIDFIETSKLSNEIIAVSVRGKLYRCNLNGKIEQIPTNYKDNLLPNNSRSITCLNWKSQNLMFLGTNNNRIFGVDLRTNDCVYDLQGHTSGLKKISYF